ncbi:hypothetical protein PAMP_014224 [Pampus punctatissimus]
MALPKTIFGHGSRCPQTSPVGQACEGNFWHCLTPGRGKNKMETMWFMRTLEGEHECLLVSQVETLNGRFRFIDDEERPSLDEISWNNNMKPSRTPQPQIWQEKGRKSKGRKRGDGAVLISTVLTYCSHYFTSSLSATGFYHVVARELQLTGPFSI